MDVPLLPADAPLPDDVAALQRMVRELLAEVARLRAANTDLQNKLDQALKHRFGRRSERRRPSPGRARKTSRPQAATSTAAPPCPSTWSAARWSTT